VLYVSRQLSACCCWRRKLLEAHHTRTGAEVFIVIAACSWALFVAAFSWLSYVALEPYVRRHCPDELVDGAISTDDGGAKAERTRRSRWCRE